MQVERIDIPPTFGDELVKKLEEWNSTPIALIIVALPLGHGQPSFCSNLDPPVMEHILEQIGEQIVSMSPSRHIVKAN